MLARRMCRRQVDGRGEGAWYTVCMYVYGVEREREKGSSRNYFLVLNGVTEEKVIMGVRRRCHSGSPLRGREGELDVYNEVALSH